MKRLQNKIAESGLTLPVAVLFGLVVWLLAGLLTQRLWPQLVCFVASVCLLVELSNQNALLRIRSRMVSSVFVVLSSTVCFLFSSFTGGLVQLCFIAALLFLFQTYQDPQAVGRTFYAFLSVGLASMASATTLYYVPLLWILMATQLQSLSGRTCMASLIGLVTPYWFALLWLIYIQDFTPLAEHFSSLIFTLHLSPFTLPLGNILVYVFTLLLAAVGMVHFWHFSYEDKIRIRLLYGFFSTMTIFTLLLVVLQAQHYDVLMRIAFICASPLTAHVFTFTSSRLSNILFFVALALAIALTTLNLITINF
ncbi:MAG: hypothetical protein IJ570_03720 [Prevotella sp.]|nr:hypothetical protein [Prevotella sp.]